MKKYLVAFLLILSIGLVGCSDNGETKESAKNVTDKKAEVNKIDKNKKAELIEQVNELKKNISVMEELQKMEEDLANKNTDEEFQADMDESVQLGRDGINDLQKQLKDIEAELNSLNK